MYHRFILVCVFQLLLSSVNAQNRQLLTKTDDLTYCLDSSEFKIGDFYYTQPIAEILKLLGSPDSTWINEGPSETIFYKDLRIELNSRRRVYYIATKDEALKTPSGIHVGQTRNEVFKILGVKPTDIPSIKFENQFVNCKYEVYLILVFDQTLILKGLEMGIDLP